MDWRDRLIRKQARTRQVELPCACPYRCLRHPDLYDINAPAREAREPYVTLFGGVILPARKYSDDGPLANFTINRDGSIQPYDWERDGL